MSGSSSLPYSEPLRVHQIGAGLQRRLEPDADTRKRIARALDLQALDAFQVDISLTPTVSGWRLDGRIGADAVQTCGLSLEPLPVRIDQSFVINLIERSDNEPEDEEIDLELDDDSPDVIEEGRIDLGQYAVEQLALRLDPFPRKPGARFEQPPEPGTLSPFGVLQALRPKDDGDKG